MLCYLAAGLTASWLAGPYPVVHVLVFVLLTWLLGRRVLRLSWPDLGWATTGHWRGFLLGLGAAAALAVATLLVGVGFGGAHWLKDGGTMAGYAKAVALTLLTLAPAALAEELAFRGFPLVVLERAVGRGSAIVVMSVLFAALHAWNPSVTALGLGNIALAGVLLGLAFFAPGGIWTAWGAHLGWNLSIAALDAPVSGLPFTVPLVDFSPGPEAWLTGGSFGPEGGVAATVVLGLGSVWLARYLRKDVA